jgi:PIN domain nuclease of toxin-antitoxin system
MRLLLDSHALIWFVDSDHLLSRPAHAAITDPANELLLSAATIWELGIKVGLSKLSLSAPYRQWMSQAMTDLSVMVLPITIEYVDVPAALPSYHRDPFDRLLIAQSQVENMPLVSNDPIFDRYGINRLW